jgi:putative flippase GtrA
MLGIFCNLSFVIIPRIRSTKGTELRIQTIIKSRFVGFALVGGGVFLLGLALLWILVEILGIDKYLAGVIVTLLTLELNFVFNKYINWADRSGSFFVHWWRFHVVRASGLVVNQIGYVILVSIGLNYVAVSTGLMVAIMIFNYLGSDRIAFQ